MRPNNEARYQKLKDGTTVPSAESSPSPSPSPSPGAAASYSPTGVTGGKLVVVGGISGSLNSPSQYRGDRLSAAVEDVSDWTTDGTTTERTGYLAYVRSDSIGAFFLGGSKVSGDLIWDTYSMSGATSTLLAARALPERRTLAAAAHFQGAIYLMGGLVAGESGSTGSVIPTVVKLRDGAETWESAEGLPAARSGGSALTFNNTLYYFFGSETTGLSTSTNNVYVTTDGATWTEHPFRPPEALVGVNFAILGTTVYYCGGYLAGGSVTNACYQ